MSNFKERALDIVNHFAFLVPELTDDVSRKSDYIYVDDPSESRWVEVSFDSIAKKLPSIASGEQIDTEQIVEAILAVEGIDDASEEFKDAIYYEVDNSWGFQYNLALNYLEKAKKEVIAINVEAGETILNPWVLDTMLSGATEFYESSRCW